MPRYKVGASVMTKKNMLTKMYTIDAESVEKAELKARKEFAERLNRKSIRGISAFAIRVS